MQVGGCPITNSIFFTFRPKKVHVFAPGDNFPVFTQESDRLCFRLTIDMILDLLTHLQPLKL